MPRGGYAKNSIDSREVGQREARQTTSETRAGGGDTNYTTAAPRRPSSSCFFSSSPSTAPVTALPLPFPLEKDALDDTTTSAEGEEGARFPSDDLRGDLLSCASMSERAASPFFLECVLTTSTKYLS